MKSFSFFLFCPSYLSQCDVWPKRKRFLGWSSPDPGVKLVRSYE